MKAINGKSPITRNLTPLFTRHRDRRAARKLGGGLHGDVDRLLDVEGGRKEVSLEMAPLPPQWVEAAEQAREDIKTIKDKMVQLEKAQSKRLIRVFSDDKTPDREVERISNEVSNLVKRCENSIHQVKTRGTALASEKDRELRQNMQRNLATQLQQLSQHFRQSQKDYLNDIRNRQKGGLIDDVAKGSMPDADIGFTDGQLQDLQEMEQSATVRNEEINKIAASITDLHTIFKELAVLVIDQGSILDRIDYNIEQVVHQSAEANKQLRKAEESQKSNRAHCHELHLLPGHCQSCLDYFADSEGQTLGSDQFESSLIQEAFWPALCSMGKKAGYVDPDDERIQKGQRQLIEESAKWKGPGHKERQQEREVRKAMKNRAKQPQEKASWKQQAAGWFFILFMCGIGFFSFLFSISDFIIGNGVVTLDVQDTAKLKKVLFGGDPWLIYCINDETVNHRLPQILEESGRSLWRSLGLSVGILRCWDQTSSGRSVAQRFSLSLKPPLSFVVANGNKPRPLPLTGISKVEDLEKRIKPALVLEIHRIDALKKWSTICTSRRSCVVVGHKNTAQRDTALNVLRPLQEKFRSLKVVSLDTSFWQLKLEESLLATRSKEKGGADVLCLTRDDSTGNATYGGLFMQSMDASSATSFLQACADQQSAPLKSMPRIKARPSKPKKVTATSAPAPRPKPSQQPAPPHRKGKVDQVGSRDSLQDEEPLFEAVRNTFQLQT
ncbi:SYP42 [Symbiodinium sp. CCMP2592]|nr:SYP42 [Symbiodinium sp. CCMP2592]